MNGWRKLGATSSQTPLPRGDPSQPLRPWKIVLLVEVLRKATKVVAGEDVQAVVVNLNVVVADVVAKLCNLFASGISPTI